MLKRIAESVRSSRSARGWTNKPPANGALGPLPGLTPQVLHSSRTSASGNPPRQQKNNGKASTNNVDLVFTGSGGYLECCRKHKAKLGEQHEQWVKRD